MVYEEYVQGDLLAWNLLRSNPSVNGNITWDGLDGDLSKWFRVFGVLKNNGNNNILMPFSGDTNGAHYYNEIAGVGLVGIRLGPGDANYPVQYMIDSYIYADTSAGFWHTVKTHVSYMSNTAWLTTATWMGYWNQTSTPINMIEVKSASSLTGWLNLYEIAPTW